MAKQAPKKAAVEAAATTTAEQSTEAEATAVTTAIDPRTVDLRMEKARQVKIAALMRREPFVKELVRENEEMRAELIRLAAK
jgi:hypothetical protein